MNERLARKAIRENKFGLFCYVQNNLRRKVEKLEKGGFHRVNRFLPHCMGTLDTFLTHEPLIFRREVDIKYSLGAHDEETLWYNDGYLPVLRENNRMIFKNPYFNMVESWAKPLSLSRVYGKHTPNSGNPDASAYLPGIDYKGLEFNVFNHGKGYLQDDAKIFLYGKFGENVGLHSSGKLSDIIKLDVRRIKKPYGTYTQIHGYPISKDELERDCPDKLIENIVNQRLSIYEG